MPDIYTSPADDQNAALHAVPPVSDASDDTDDLPEGIDPRHLKRIDRMQALFAYSFGEMDTVDDLQREYVERVLPDLPTIDSEIKTVAPERPLTEINKVDLAILRLIVFESRHKKTPKKVLIDEAVELAKEYGTDSSSAFVNAVLGKIVLSTEAPHHDESTT